VTAFSPLLDVLADVPDPRRAEGKRYKLPHVLLFSILAIVTGGNSYRAIATFIDVHRHKLNNVFSLNWSRAPAHTAIRYILKALDPTAVETAFRRHAARLQAVMERLKQRASHLMGKHSVAASTSSTTVPPRSC
jgi:hypothetical protein